jgi:hypothetical protein
LAEKHWAASTTRVSGEPQVSGFRLFEIERRSPGDGKQALMYVREKPRGAPARKSASAKTADAKTTSARSARSAAVKAPAAS